MCELFVFSILIEFICTQICLRISLALKRRSTQLSSTSTRTPCTRHRPPRRSHHALNWLTIFCSSWRHNANRVSWLFLIVSVKWLLSNVSGAVPIGRPRSDFCCVPKTSDHRTVEGYLNSRRRCSRKVLTIIDLAETLSKQTNHSFGRAYMVLTILSIFRNEFE